MKKVLLATTAAIMAFASCTQNEEFENQTQNAEISIGTVVKKTSRATVTDNSNFTAFKVSSFIVDASFNFATTALGSPFMDGVLYEGGQNKWTTTDANKYYWPTDKNVQFFAYPNGLTLTAPASDPFGYPTLAFSIDANAATQKDLVLASENMNKPEGGKANLNFKHVLTRINFSYKPEAGYTYAITELKINGVKGGQATYTYAADVTKGVWAGGTSVTEGYTYPITVAQSAVDGFYTLDSVSGSLMLLPQELSGATIAITYKTTKNGAIFFDNTKTVSIPENSKWEVGKNIRYKLTLPAGDSEIGIATSVTDWDGETPENLE